ncbi:hypothetical protein ERO13_A03G112800v2 [Gossypium hirsutum]|uniref:anthranilate synthase n=3 Tax=Gossypium TaxID=3633 RepID=A0A1U8HNZ1_GOSHI|nr:anthranilate synthase beta subunit 1, chloroplastic-like isoform X3 [Gossypium hirsutum]KAB2090455.1 hypothetical protein ES319_A03G124300v1 [Gossypium barbadense]KAG4208141.1 hypothetical protein ERO13_A03G112800v2 [Gossypium hirsutum]
MFVFCQSREVGLWENSHSHRLYRIQHLQFRKTRKSARIPLSSLTIMIVSPTIFARKNPRGVLISPGPGTPQDSGISLKTVLELGPIVPLFGVCMGLQCIGDAFGGKIIRSPYGVMHGTSSLVYHDEKGEDGLLAGLSNPFNAGRYHSLVIEKDTFPEEALEVTAWTEDGLIMAARHKVYKHVQGVQFHPESIITWEGKTIVLNFVKLIERKEAAESRIVNSAHNWLSSKCQIWVWESTLEIHHLCIWTNQIYPSNLVLG